MVGVQLNCALPARRWLFGNSGEGRTILPASRIRLSQKISSALSPGSGAARVLAWAFFSPGRRNRLQFGGAKVGTAEIRGLNYSPNLQRNFEHERVFSQIHFQQKRANFEHVAGRQCFVFFNRLAVELYRIGRTQAKQKIVVARSA